jgi:WD40 repeat protein
MTNWKCIKTLTGHVLEINSLCVTANYNHNKLLVSGSSDYNIRIWDLDSGDCIKTLCSHTGSISSIYMSDNLIISGSYDTTINIYPITLFPGEYDKFISFISGYELIPYLEQHLMDCFNPDKD